MGALAVQRYSDDTGEAETGSAGEQPDQGIAGAELIADDEKGVVLPTRSFAWARGRPAGGGRFPPWDLVLTLLFGFEPHRTDRFRPALKTHTEAPQYFRLLFEKMAGVARRELCLRATVLTSRNCGPSMRCHAVAGIGFGGDAASLLGLNMVMIAASGVLPVAGAALAASCSNSSGVR